MTPNTRILKSAYEVIHGRLQEPTDARGKPIAGMCLKQVRVIVEHAFGMRSHQWYEDYVTEWVQPDGYDRSLGHWARDAERSLRNLGMAVPLESRRPGDLMFNWRTAYSQRWGAFIGHVGVLLPGDLILENINPSFRVGRGFARYTTGITPVSAWEDVTTVVRFFPRGNS